MLPAPDAKVSYLDDAYRVSRDIRQDARRIIQYLFLGYSKESRTHRLFGARGERRQRKSSQP